MMLHASRVGPSSPSRCSPVSRRARAGGDPQRQPGGELQVVSGVGAKLAQRIVLELRDRASSASEHRAGATTPAPGRPGRARSYLSALVNLGAAQPGRATWTEVVASTVREGADRGAGARRAAEAVAVSAPLERREVSREARAPEESSYEESLRPQRLDEMVARTSCARTWRCSSPPRVSAASHRPTCSLRDPPGLGKPLARAT